MYVISESFIDYVNSSYKSIRKSYVCWNNFLGPKCIHFRLECHSSKLKLGWLLCPCKYSTWREMQSILLAKHQASSGIYPYFLVLFHPKQGRLCSPSQSDRFSFFLFLIPYSLPIKVSCLLPHFAPLRMETVYFMNC